VRGLLRAIKFFQYVASSNGLILFVGTKRQAAETIVECCARTGMPYVTERWLGGTLTNFRTIRSRLERLEELETILDGEQALSYSKKMISTLTRERRKMERNLSGIRHMNRLPEALMVIDPRREHIAVAEAKKLGIKVVALLDTDCDPDDVDLPIPGNDDSMRSIELVLNRLTEAILEGKAAAPVEPAAEEGSAGGRGDRDRRRGGPGGRGDGLRGVVRQREPRVEAAAETTTEPIAGEPTAESAAGEPMAESAAGEPMAESVASHQSELSAGEPAGGSAAAPQAGSGPDHPVPADGS